MNVSDTLEVRGHCFKSCFQALISQLLLKVVHVTAIITHVFIENLLSGQFSTKSHNYEHLSEFAYVDYANGNALVNEWWQSVVAFI